MSDARKQLFDALAAGRPYLCFAREALGFLAAFASLLAWIGCLFAGLDLTLALAATAVFCLVVSLGQAYDEALLMLNPEPSQRLVLR